MTTMRSFLLFLSLLVSGSSTETELVKVQPRIVGGTEVKNEYKYPFFTHIGICGGTLIHGDIVLTAAHCVRPLGMTAQVGARVKGSTEDGSVYATIDEQIFHPDFSDGNNGYDFMLIKLGAWVPKQTVTLNSELNFAHSQQEGGADNLSTVMGFGMTEEDGEESDVLMEVQVGLITGEMCGEIYNMFDFQDDIMICAMDTGKDSCVGDSGGPLLYQGVQVGITSWVSSIGY